MKTVQKFSDDYLQRCSVMSPDEIARFLDDFRCIHGKKKTPTKLISLKVPEDLLQTFKTKSKLNDVPYQTQIKRLMAAWLAG